MPAPFRAPTAAANTASSGVPVWAVLLMLAVAIVPNLLGGANWFPAPQPAPAPPGPSLVAAFKTNDNRQQARTDAHVFATICTSLAEFLEYDGTRPQPLIATGVQIDDFRRGLRQTRTKGWSFLTRYPELHTALEAYLTEQVGTSGGPIDQAQRAKWVAAFRTIAASAEYAAKEG